MSPGSFPRAPRPLVALLALVAGCLALLAGCDSLIGSPCTDGYQLTRGSCTPINGGGGGDAGGDPSVLPDAGEPQVEPTPDAPPTTMPDAGEPLVCTAPEIACGDTCTDPDTDANNCGRCGNVCASGICSVGMCAGDMTGHIVAIGHDYTRRHFAMARVLGNSVSLGRSNTVAVARWQGTATDASRAGTAAAIAQAMAYTGRPYRYVPLSTTPSLTGVDVLLIEAQTGDGAAAQAAGVPWASQVDQFLRRGGVVIVLEGAGGVSHRLAQGAGVFTVATPVDVTGQQARVVAGGDAVALQVVSPYLAETSTVSWPGMPAVIATTGGATVVFHTTRP